VAKIALGRRAKGGKDDMSDKTTASEAIETAEVFDMFLWEEGWTF
jgi:hypothetical protein